MKETTITIKHAVAATRRQKWQQRNTNVNLNFFHNCRSDRSAALSPSHSHLRRRIVWDAARGCDVRVRACVYVYVCAVLPCSKWTLLWNVFSILCPLSTPLKQNSNAGADVDSVVGGSGSGCYCGCEPWHQKCWPHFPDPPPSSLSLTLSFPLLHMWVRRSAERHGPPQCARVGEMVVVVGGRAMFSLSLAIRLF